jgi:hypothetical protein
VARLDDPKQVLDGTTPEPAQPRRRGALGPVPEANVPGHHPPVEADKPSGPPNQDPLASLTPRRQRFAFEFDPWLTPFALVFGVTPRTAWVDVSDDHLEARFGLWRLRTPRHNIVGAETTGPYTWFKVAGPAHLSFKDRGVTFATNTRAGVCIRFRTPVGGVYPGLRHPALTVTVAAPDALVAALDVEGPAG